MVMDLVEIYFQVVYPIFPFFHQPSFVRNVSRGEYQTNKSKFVLTMATCALASARARDGAIITNRWDISTLRHPSSEVFFVAAESALPTGPTKDFDYMRAYALLSITAIQHGKTRSMLHYLGLYQTCVEVEGLHDEVNWPQNISLIEREERRRLFWSMYTLDVYTAIAWRRVIRSRESQSNVVYPTPVDDSAISESSCQTQLDTLVSRVMTLDSSLPLCWLHGWNFTTDLYRILEHVVAQFRQRQPEHRMKTHIDAIFAAHSAPSSFVLDAILNMYRGLPARFKETRVTSSDADHRLNFQTANIAATIQLVRIMLFTDEDATVDQRCRVASELLQAFSDIPVIYLRAISSPLLHHLASIGSILGSTLENGLPESSYKKIRNVLVSMISLLSDLEVGLYCTTGASTRIQKLVDRLDEYIHNQQQQDSKPQPLQDDGNGAQVLIADENPPYVSSASPVFLLPSELLDNWSWAFDFTQPSSTDHDVWKDFANVQA
jgi:hypothetical protein